MSTLTKIIVILISTCVISGVAVLIAALFSGSSKIVCANCEGNFSAENPGHTVKQRGRSLLVCGKCYVQGWGS